MLSFAPGDCCGDGDDGGDGGDGDLHRDENAGKLDRHQSSRDNTLQLRREPLRWKKNKFTEQKINLEKSTHENPREANDGNASGEHEDEDEDHLVTVVNDGGDDGDAHDGSDEKICRYCRYICAIFSLAVLIFCCIRAN